jgi:hypothetical protein
MESLRFILVKIYKTKAEFPNFSHFSHFTFFYCAPISSAVKKDDRLSASPGFI